MRTGNTMEKVMINLKEDVHKFAEEELAKKE